MKQTLIPNVSVASAVRSVDGATLVGRSGIKPMAARVGADNQLAWAFTFGADLERPVEIAALDADDYLVAFAGKVLLLPAAGAGASVVSFDPPSKTNVRSVEPTAFASVVLRREPSR